MVKFADLPPYVHRNNITQKHYEIWVRDIEYLKKTLIFPIIESGEPKFDMKIQIDYQKVKTFITSDYSSLVKYFLMCMKELGKKSDTKPRILVSLLLGQQDYREDDILKNLRDGYHYGHLRKLQDIYFEYEHGMNKTYYLNMMKVLCEPYTDVMKSIIYMCHDLFKKTDENDLSSLFTEVKNEDYIGGS